MDRREFIEQVAGWSAGACLAAPLFDVQAIMAADADSEEKSDNKPMLVVAEGKGKDYAALVEAVLKPLGGMKAFVKKGDRVVVKPNIGWDRKPEQAANTHPEVVKAVVLQCLEAGAKSVLVFDRTCNDMRRCYANSGIKKAVESIDDPRVKCEYENKRDYVPVKIANGKSIDEFEFNRNAMKPECDCYINVPVAKHHRMAKLTLGLKNVMGVIGGNRGIIHKDLDRRIADLNLVIRPDLTIIDATRILLKHGPAGGKLEDVKTLDTLIASADTVAADAYATTLFDKEPDYLGSTVAAASLGLGEMDLEKVNVVKV